MTSHRVQIAGSDIEFVCSESDSLLRGALRAGVALPYECSSGGCSACMFELVSGDLADLWPQAPGLSARARENGRRLACQTAPLSPCAIKIRLARDTSRAPPPHRRRAMLREVTPLTRDMSIFRFHSEDGATFLPGQYALLDLPGVTGSRAYSMCNLPNSDGRWDFIIKRTPGGQATTRLFDEMSPGTDVTLDAPFGGAVLNTEIDDHLVCVGGGSGLSPLLSILRAASEAQPLRPLTLFYGARTRGDLCVDELIDSDPLLRGRVQCISALSEEQPTDKWDGEHGLITDVLERTLGHRLSACDFHFCGPPPMIDAMQRLLLIKYKLPANRLHFDRFF